MSAIYYMANYSDFVELLNVIRSFSLWEGFMVICGGTHLQPGAVCLLACKTHKPGQNSQLLAHNSAIVGVSIA